MGGSGDNILLFSSLTEVAKKVVVASRDFSNRYTSSLNRLPRRWGCISNSAWPDVSSRKGSAMDDSSLLITSVSFIWYQAYSIIYQIYAYTRTL